MKASTLLFSIACFLAAFIAPPALAANVAAGLLGLFVLGNKPAQPAPVVVVREVPPKRAPEPRVFQVRGGIVVFEDRGGNTVSRFYPA